MTGMQAAVCVQATMAANSLSQLQSADAVSVHTGMAHVCQPLHLFYRLRDQMAWQHPWESSLGCSQATRVLLQG